MIKKIGSILFKTVWYTVITASIMFALVLADKGMLLPSLGCTAVTTVTSYLTLKANA